MLREISSHLTLDAAAESDVRKEKHLSPPAQSDPCSLWPSWQLRIPQIQVTPATRLLHRQELVYLNNSIK